MVCRKSTAGSDASGRDTALRSRVGDHGGFTGVEARSSAEAAVLGLCGGPQKKLNIALWKCDILSSASLCTGAKKVKGSWRPPHGDLAELYVPIHHASTRQLLAGFERASMSMWILLRLT